ncbi:phosphoheptose isomerase [Flavobacterium sp. F-328]|jgi:mannose-6-phosphate isomerase-like protein (cupin superfamily)|uniref:Phosphoheptose isomerase n=1 Tax=Flavobacterium erciyesense TaxID=2825842 RepID=A0ABS5D7L6_9FLAO|nr:phosphoheptose isomerase [Flavobacterium erciyesense]MBQ0909991.1 phosphoheptose isomerase [Flavobacterium erciyesense]
MQLQLSKDLDKSVVFDEIRNQLETANYTIENEDQTRPWGGFFVINEEDTNAFAANFFPNLDSELEDVTAKRSPKILVVAPSCRLSWQYHFRRSEVWKVVNGPVGVKISDTDEEGDLKVLETGDFIKMNTGERHRLVGLNTWGVVAEIWQHTDPDHPSDEEDIVRLQDDFGR